MAHQISPGTAAMLQGMADDVLGTLTAEEVGTWRHEDLVGAAIDLVGMGHDSLAAAELTALLEVLGYDKLVARGSGCKGGSSPPFFVRRWSFFTFFFLWLLL
jgi:hypothetical protein